MTVHGAIGAFALYRMTRRPTVPAEERATYVALPTPTPVVTSLAQESASSQPDTANATAAAELADAG